MKDEPPLGSHLVSSRNGYTHHGIYAGNGRVVHYSGRMKDSRSGIIEEVPLDTFHQGHGFRVAMHGFPASPADVIARARSRLGEESYSVFANNCEHFCNWCVTGDHLSKQVDFATAAGTVSLASVAGVAGRAMVAASGPVYGLSGAGVMGGLAGIGSVIGGGAVAGLAVLSAVPAIAAASLVNSTVLADPGDASPQERHTRRVGRVASYAGAMAGTAGSVAAVSGMGTVAGLSAAGITSGLSALGGLIGGGMGLGVAIATTAPVIATAAVGYTTYKLTKAVVGRRKG